MDGIAWAGSAMVAARARLEIASENLANVSTGGFRRLLACATLTPNGVNVEPLRAHDHGAYQRTGRDFDLALVGDGAFNIRDAAGAIRESRNGHFTRERDGSLTDPAGGVLLSAGGGPLHVPDGAGVDERGRVVAQSGAIVDRLALPATTTVRSGFLESANVDAVSEMIDVLAAERSFESAQKVVTAIDGTRQKASEAARIK